MLNTIFLINWQKWDQSRVNKKSICLLSQGTWPVIEKLYGVQNRRLALYKKFNWCGSLFDWPVLYFTLYYNDSQYLILTRAKHFPMYWVKLRMVRWQPYAVNSIGHYMNWLSFYQIGEITQLANQSRIISFQLLFVIRFKNIAKKYLHDIQYTLEISHI